MKILPTSLYLTVLLFVCFPVQGAIINDKDWLRVDDTRLFSWEAMDAIFDVVTGYCDVSECVMYSAMAGSIDMTGYRWASNLEVNSLWTTFTGQDGLDSLTSDNFVRTPNTDRAGQLISIVGATDSSQGLVVSTGFTRDHSTVQFWDYDADTEPQMFLDDGIKLKVGVGGHSSYIGGWFYKVVAVDEPSVLVLLVSGLFGLGFIARNLTRFVAS